MTLNRAGQHLELKVHVHHRSRQPAADVVKPGLRRSERREAVVERPTAIVGCENYGGDPS
jgi:hypothetical protein